MANAWLAYNAVEIEAGGGWQASFLNETDIDALRDCTYFCHTTPLTLFLFLRSRLRVTVIGWHAIIELRLAILCRNYPARLYLRSQS